MDNLKLSQSAFGNWGNGLQVAFGSERQLVHYRQPDVLQTANAPTPLFNPAAGAPATPQEPVVTFATASPRAA